ncbi:MAG: hypothetical protein MEQ74_03965 [Paracoccus sp.]|nr:hypothetical protein [Paracoccus sp. (in: a-proteobacteria)]
MAVIEWPSEHFRMSMSRHFIDWTSRSAGTGLSGHEQIIGSGTGRWRLTLALIVEPNPDRLRRFEALVSEMRGRLNTAAIPLFDAYAYDRTVSPLQIPHSDGSWHTDGTGAMTGDGQQPMVTVGTAAAGASQLTVALTNPVRPSFRVGDLFTVNGFLYRVVRRNAGGWVKVEPPLRKAIPAGTVLETDPITVHVKFATDGEGERARDLLSWGEPVTLTFIEDFDR